MNIYLFNKKNILFQFLFSFSLVFFLTFNLGFSQIFKEIFLEEQKRRIQINTDSLISNSFLLRPFLLNSGDTSLINNLSSKDFFNKSNVSFRLYPFNILTQNNIGPPYSENSTLLFSKGFQTLVSFGFGFNAGPLSIQFVPEYVFSQNLSYDTGITKSFSTEYLVKFGNGNFQKLLLGQSNFKINFGSFSTGFSNERIWWGPGQFNSLLFSYNAFGFKHLTFNTSKPAKTFLGSFEGQILVGRLEGSDFLFKPEQYNDSRYLNGFTLSYHPIWIPNLYVGFSRVFQLYERDLGSGLSSYFPILEAFQKEKLGKSQNGQFNSIEYDEIGQSQQLSGFVRYLVRSAKAEIYFEYGRRDHALNWREAILNPEHARAYLFGFSKIFGNKSFEGFQLRGEVLQQQESINLMIRGADLREEGDRSNWAGHYPISHGFTHFGEMLGPGVGPSSNVQNLEISWFQGFKKLGLRFERINRYQDRYNKLFFGPSEQRRWVDLSARFLVDWQWRNLILSSNVNFVNSLNYEWQLLPLSTIDFPQGKNLFSVHTQVSLIYLFNKNIYKKND